jgi:transposase
MLSPYMFESIRKLKSENKSQAEIARELGINPKTVAKYLRSNTPPKYKPRIKSTKKDPFLEFERLVKSWLVATPALTDQEIFELLIPQGYKGSERTINRRLKRLRISKPSERFFEQEYTPGEQAQFDFKEKVFLPFVDGERLVHLHFGTLPYSDTCLVRGYPFRNFECFMDGLHGFFESLGGMTGNIRFDNLSPCVKKVLKGGERIYTDKFKKAHEYYGFGLLPCGPGRGNEKGDVERDIRTFANRIKNRVSHERTVFRDWDHLNTWLAQYMAERTTQDTQIKLETEKKHLKSLPPREESILCQVESKAACSYGSVRFGKSTYSVPDAMIGKGCVISAGPYDVKITCHELFSNDKVIVHPRKPDGEHSLLLEHVLPSLIRKPHAMVRWAHREILFPKPQCQNFYDRLKKIDGYFAEQEYLKAINLVHHVALSEIILGMELVLESGSRRLFEDLRELLLIQRRPSVIEITTLAGQIPLTPSLSGYDSLIPKQGVCSG